MGALGLILGAASRVPWWVWAALGAAFVVWRVEQYGFERGRSHERVAATIEAAKRIQEMEKNNAEFRSLSARERCLAFMRDSGLPDTGCN